MSENTSGIWPTGYRVLVKPDNIEEVTAGGIFIPEEHRKTHMQAQHIGTIVATGLAAWESYSQPWAKVGDRVLYPRHQGHELTGKDGAIYRLLNDEQVGAVVEDGVDMTDFKRREAYSDE